MFKITVLAHLKSVENSFMAHIELTVTVALGGGRNNELSGASLMMALILFLRTESGHLLETPSLSTKIGD